MPEIKQHIEAARKVYELFWESYLSGDAETFASVLDEQLELIGTSESEIAHSKSEGLVLLEAQMHEVVGNVEKRNRKVKSVVIGDLILINELCDIYFRNEQEWNFYSRLRLSTLLRESGEGWKVVQQHGSLPDHRVEGDQTIAFEKISKENIELRDAVKRRTAELENKNREMEIEAALERVRTIAMGMKKPDDLLDVCRIISEQLNLLKIGNIRNVQVAIIDESKKIYANYQYFAIYAKSVFEETVYTDNTASSAMVKAMQKSVNSFFVGSIKGDELHKFREWRKDHNQFPDPILDDLAEVFYYFYSIGQGGLGLTTYRAINENELEIFKRFHLVFKLAYSRFMDIQKAEAQAREAQIEVAVERVRAQSMAMHHPDDLDKVNKEILTQLNSLQIQGLSGVTFYLVDHDGWVKAWDFSSPGNMGNQNSYTLQFDYKKYEMMGEPFKILQQTDLNYFVADYPIEKLDRAVFELEEINLAVADVFKEALAKGILTHQWTACARIADGLLGIDLVSPPSEDTKTIVLKIAGAFNQAYQRFLDLQKAEAQAREAQIEAALEKVRSRSLAMHKSDELNEVVSVLFEKFKELQIPFTAVGIAIGIEGSKDLNSFVCGENEAGLVITNYRLLYFDHIIAKDFNNVLGKQLDFFVGHYSKVEKDSFYEYVIDHTAEFRHLPEDIKCMIFDSPTYTISMMAVKNAVFAINDFEGKVLAESEIDIIKRFARVFDQAYTRFLDLQKAEAQAREAQIELSLEKIRGLVTSMQESTDLLDIMVNIRSEFVALGHEAHYFWYMRWLTDKYEKAMTSGDGTQVGMIMTLPRHIHGDIPLVANWEQGDEPTLIFAMDVETAVEYVDKMITQGDFEQVDPHAPTLDDIRHIGGLTFVMARTSQGEIGYSLPGEVHNPPEEAVNTLARFAGVFDLAYRRFEDLKAAEHQAQLIREERDRLEIALNELHATQAQLIQQEKLASLGQLTAGIAHEIKNPLNFVNNFSDVSIEMIDEALEELQQIGDNKHATETAAILADIQSNLTKIHEHGTRADGIVKSMLMHSRGGSGKMEPADLNALIKEYVNLSFHGMRAGKNPINVDIKLDLDDSFGKIALIEEDFSRVLLNLCNNAFDAMREKTKTDPDYKPLLSISTKQLEKTVEIAITDNGPGIPDNIKDKILQPFFTTKKGTEGTGLGLSITHDIVKAHGGELSINSKINARTEFIIHLPV